MSSTNGGSLTISCVNSLYTVRTTRFRLPLPAQKAMPSRVPATKLTIVSMSVALRPESISSYRSS